jgi:hypothetical protein
VMSRRVVSLLGPWNVPDETDPQRARPGPKSKAKVAKPARRPRRNWKALIYAAPMAEPSFTVPIDWNPACLTELGKDHGMRFRWCRMPDLGLWWVWRIA